MINEVIRNDYESIRCKCIEHEQQLIKLLNENRVEINVLRDSNEFRRLLLEKTT
jgi:hypothetical protein